MSDYKTLQESFACTTKLGAWFQSNKSKVGESFKALARKKQEKLCALLLQHSETIGANLQSEESSKAIIAVSGVMFEIMNEDEKQVLPKSFVLALGTLHEYILALLDKNAQDAVSKCCELYWTQNRSEREQLMPQTILYLLHRAMSPDAKATDVKRVSLLREVLKLFDFDDESSASLCDELARCAIHPGFIHNADGKRLLSLSLTLNVGLTNKLCETIMHQIPACRKSIVEAYGEIVFKAWKHSIGTPLQSPLEYNFIQKIADASIHGAHESLVVSLRNVLNHFHRKKKLRGVDEMLLRLYQPFLWKSLSAANATVRRQAALLFIDAFPLQDPDASLEAVDSMMQRQFNSLQEMLEDSACIVREVGVKGVCRILSLYWELIPAPVIRALLLRLVNDLSCDASSPAVRVSVFDGLAYLLENHLSHLALKPLLPRLRPLIHDKAEKVRIAMLKLLIRVKNIRSIRFFDIVPPEELLLRLVSDAKKAIITNMIVELLSASFLPRNKSAVEVLNRAITLFRQNARAAIIFYERAVSSSSAHDTLELVTLFIKCCSSWVKSQSGGGRVSTSKSSKRKELGDIEPTARNEEDYPSNGGDLTENEVHAMLESAAMIYQQVCVNLQSTEQKEDTAAETREAIKRLEVALGSGKLALLLSKLPVKCGNCLWTLAGALSPHEVQVEDLKKQAMETLLHADASTSQMTASVCAIMSWGMTSQLLDSMIRAATIFFSVPKKGGASTLAGKPGQKEASKSRGNVAEAGFAASALPTSDWESPSHLLWCAHTMLSKDECRKRMLEHSAKLRHLIATFEQVQTLVDSRILSGDAATNTSSFISSEVAAQCLVVAARGHLLLTWTEMSPSSLAPKPKSGKGSRNTKKQTAEAAPVQVETPPDITQLIDWTKNAVVAANEQFLITESVDGGTQEKGAQRKRQINDVGASPASKGFGCLMGDVINASLAIATECASIGRCDTALLVSTEVLMRVVTEASFFKVVSSKVLPMLHRAAFQLSSAHPHAAPRLLRIITSVPQVISLSSQAALRAAFSSIFTSVHEKEHVDDLSNEIMIVSLGGQQSKQKRVNKENVNPEIPQTDVEENDKNACKIRQAITDAVSKSALLSRACSSHLEKSLASGSEKTLQATLSMIVPVLTKQNRLPLTAKDPLVDVIESVVNPILERGSLSVKERNHCRQLVEDIIGFHSS